MSRIRGILPLFVVTAIGIANGAYVFGPAFREEREQKRLLSAQDEPHVSNEIKQIPEAKSPLIDQPPDGLSKSKDSQNSP